MRRIKRRALCALWLSVLWIGGLSPVARADLRTFEFRFQLSADPGSEFGAKLPVFKDGPLVVQAEWQPPSNSSEAVPPVPLTLILLRPGGAEAARTSGTSPLRFEIRLTAQDLGAPGERGRASWTVKIINAAPEGRREVAGTLKVSLPILSGTLTEIDFTLLGAGNAQEVPFTVTSPGRVLVEARWENDHLTGPPAGQTPLVLSLTHLGQSRTYARRLGKSPLRIEHQITERDNDAGLRWVARLQNDGPAKLTGVLKITFAPDR